MLFDYLNKHKVKNIIDVGAHFGEYAQIMWSVDRGYHIFSIEANKECESVLSTINPNYSISCLSNSNDIKKFYRTKEDLKCTGNSLYRENSHHYSDEKIDIVELETFTLDFVLEKYQPNVLFDFLKMDTQGAELDILLGATKTLNSVKLIQAETDVSGYNIGAPKQSEVVKHLDSLGFRLVGIVDNIQYGGKLLQQDLLFERI